MVTQKNIPFEYTNRPVLAWGGMRLMKELINHTGIMALLSENRMVVNAWLRPGNTEPASGMQPFLEETQKDWTYSDRPRKKGTKNIGFGSKKNVVGFAPHNTFRKKF